MMKHLAIKFAAVVMLFTSLDLLYTSVLFDHDLKRMAEHVWKMKQEQDSTDIFYFSESSNWNARDDDSVKLSISELTQLFFPRLKVRAVNQPASHAGMYRYWLTQLDLRKKPKAVVVVLNMRSFDAMWRNSKLETPLQESLVLMWPYPNLVNRFLLALNAYDNRDEKVREELMLKEWRETELIFPYPVKFNTVRKWDDGIIGEVLHLPEESPERKKAVLACHNVKAFAFNLNENNERIKDFDAIYRFCEANQLPLYFNLMAENIQYADSLVGKDLLFLMRQNKDFLMSRYNKGSCKVVDNFETVRGIEFTDQNWTTEHYGYRGRMIIAKNLAATLKEQFNSEYINAY